MDVKRLVNAEGVTDHTALLPTKKKELVDFDSLTENERKVLELVYQNLEEATSKPYKYEKTTVKISYQGEVFTASGVRNIELGWKKNRPDETKEQFLPEFHEGDKIDINDVFIKKHQTEPPEPFTDGKLLKEMEIAGKEVWETLITNLNRFEFPVSKMKDMYRLRWGIETSFRNLKYALGAVQFHSRKDDFVEMELFAHFTMYNAVSRCINQVSVPQSTANKHTYAIDFKMAVVLIREYLRLFNNHPFGQLYAEILSYKVAVRPDRHDTRKLIKPKSPVWFVYRVA